LIFSNGFVYFAFTHMTKIPISRVVAKGFNGSRNLPWRQASPTRDFTSSLPRASLRFALEGPAAIVVVLAPQRESCDTAPIAFLLAVRRAIDGRDGAEGGEHGYHDCRELHSEIG
jgi:hypothetical protein